MKAEIIAVGTELLLGQIVNTNAQYLSQKCADLGLDVYYQTVVGDNKQRLIDALRFAGERADFIICTGGLGPTQDDLTKEALAAHLDKKLITHKPSMSRILQFFEQRKIPMVESNAKQAIVLEDGDVLMNDNGMAAGVAISMNGKHYILLPGPPREMKLMFDTYASEWIRGLLPDSKPLFSKVLRFAGIGESLLENKLIDLINGQVDPTIAPYAKEGEVALRLSTKADSRTEADMKLAETEKEIGRRLGNHLYADEDLSLEEVVIRLLRRKQSTLSLAESCTGGFLSHLLTNISGSSEVFKGGIVCYTNEVKSTLLHVEQTVLDRFGAVSRETAEQLADNAAEQFSSEYALSVTGVAGPDEQEGKPVGLIYIAVKKKGCPAEVEKVQLTGNRQLIKLRAAKFALFKLWQCLKEER